jgi:hypothetical protein
MRELAVALTQVIDALIDPSLPSLVVTEAEIDFPMEVSAATRQGELVFFGSAPHSRWVSGFLPDVHVAKLRVELMEARCGR